MVRQQTAKLTWGSSVPGQPTVSVVVAARNNGPFLGDALASALHQSVPAVDVVYVDDGSTDDSAEVAEQFEGVQVIRQDHRGVCVARNRGVEATRGDYVLFQDGDDILPHRYLEQRLRWVSSGSSGPSFVYGAAQAFGGSWNYYWEAPPWDTGRLWCGNYVNTSTLFRRNALLSVGGWQPSIGTAWDWDLALRLGQAGHVGQAAPDSFLLYRHHPDSHSSRCHLKETTNTPAIDRMKLMVRAMRCRLAVLGVISGRLPGLFSRWLEAVDLNYRCWRDSMHREPFFSNICNFWLPKPALRLLYTGPPERYGAIDRAISGFQGCFDVSVERREWRNGYADERERRDNLSRFLASAYNGLLRQEELVWMVEDDIIPPDDSLDRMARAVLGGPTPLYGACIGYRNRHRPSELVAHHWDGQDPATIRTLATRPVEPTYYDMVGTGCLLAFRPFAHHGFHSHYQAIAAHDWRWCLDLKRYRQDYHPPNKQIMMLPEPMCRHHQTEEVWV